MISSAALSTTIAPFQLWHSRLAHLSLNKVKGLLSNGSLGNISDCFGCKLGKQHAIPFKKSFTVTNAPFDLIHSDIWGPASQPTKGGSLYYVLFVDDYTRYTWIYLLKHKSDFFSVHCIFSNGWHSI